MKPGRDLGLQLCPAHSFDHGPGTWQAVQSLRANATAAVMAANPAPPPLATTPLMLNGWRTIGTRSRTRSDTPQVMGWLQRGLLSLKDVITHRFEFSELAEAERVVTGRIEPTRMVVAYPASRIGSRGAAQASAVA